MRQPLLPLSEISIDDQKDDLTRIVRYASIKTKTPLTRWDKIIYGTIAFVTWVAPISYLRPAYDDEPFGLPNDNALKWNQVAGTWVPTAYVFYSADIDFLQIRASYIIPEELIDILEGMTKEQIRRQDWGIGTISALSAIPLTTPLVKYPLIATGDSRYDIPGNVVLITVILIANSIAHLRPLQEIVKDPRYGFLFFLLLGIWELFKRLFKRDDLTDEEKLAKKAAEQKAAYNAQLKAQLVQTLLTKKDQLLDSCFTPICRGILGYELKLTNDFQRISELEDESFVTELRDYKHTSEVIESKPPTLGQRAYPFFLDGVGQIGALMVLGEAIGYLSNAGFTLADMTGIVPVGWLLAAVPIYAFGVLMHMIGRDSYRGYVDFLISFVQGKSSLSWPIKYCSKIFFGLCFIPNLELAYMTPGSANTMIRGDLQDYWGEKPTETYIGVFRWAFVGLVAFLMPALERYLFTKWAKYFGTEAAKKVVAFEEKVEQIATLLPKWKDERFLQRFPEPPVHPQPPSTPHYSVNVSPRSSWRDWIPFSSWCSAKPNDSLPRDASFNLSAH